MESTENIFPHYDSESLALISRAREIAANALKDDVRYDGSAFFLHPEGVAQIVSNEIGLTADCVAAVYLHETIRAHPETDSSVWDFPEGVMKLVDGLNNIAKIKPKDTRLEAENYKKLIVQYSTDPRVTVLKIADRLEVMRSLSMFPAMSRERKILETLLLYIPLAHQLGLYNIKGEMENIYLAYIEPTQYRAINNKLKATEKDREKLMNEFIEPLKKTLDDEGINYKLKIRTKSAYSIYKKMKKQKVPFEGVYDVFAIRFIIDCENDSKVEQDLCWKVYSYVTQEYEADTSRLRDWITNPKPNGYESLHITVKNKNNSYLEVQIRTKRMDDEAENGNAAHWSYKGIKHEQTLDKWLSSVRYNLEHPMNINPEDLPQAPDKEIFVFTPTSELRTLPVDSTVLDFAFNIHSNLGIKCTGGRINGKVASIKEKLHTGDVVEIISSKNQKPSPDWLNFVVSSKAKNRIRQALHDAEYKKATLGKELLERRLKNWKLELPDEIMVEMMRKLHYPTIYAFYAAVEDESVDLNYIKNYILDHDAMVAESIARAAEIDAAKIKHSVKLGSSDDILVLNARNLKGIDYKMAKCCNPVFGDDVFGFVTRDEGIKIHRISCPNAARLIEMYPYRIQKVKWTDTPSSGTFQVSLRIVSEMEAYIINQIMDVVNSFKASLRTFNVNENQRNGTYDISIKVSVASNLELDKVVSQIRALKGVLKINRV